MRKLIVAGVAVVATLAFAVSGALGQTSETGVTARTIVVGGTFPLTGPAASYAPIPVGMKAYFSYINARRGPDGKRGVYGRQIVWKYYDDGYNPANTVQMTRKLVEQDKVFATVGQLGTEPDLAVRPYLNEQKVPQVLVSTGATEFDAQWQSFPWTIGWQPDYIAEGRIYGLHIKANHSGQKIAVLYQNDDYGKDYLYGLKEALGSTYSQQYIVDAEPFEVTAPSVTSQMARIKASAAPIFVILGTPPATIRAYAAGKALGYKPDQIYLNSVSATTAFLNVARQAAGDAYVSGSLSVAYLKDPSQSVWDEDAAMKQYRQIMAKYAPGANANDPLYLYGVAKAETFVQALYKAGQNLTRAGLMSALLSLNTTNRFALPGVVEKTSKTDHYILSQMQLQRFTVQNGTGVWVPVGKLIQGRPR